MRSERQARHADRRRTAGKRARSHHGVAVAGVLQADGFAIRWGTADGDSEADRLANDRRVRPIVRQRGRRGRFDRLAHIAGLAARKRRIAAVDREDVVRPERQARHADRRRTTGERARSHDGVAIAGVLEAHRLAVRWGTTDGDDKAHRLTDDGRVRPVIRQCGRGGRLDRLAHRARLAARKSRVTAVDCEDIVRSERQARHADRRRTAGKRARSHHGVAVAGVLQADGFAIRWGTADGDSEADRLANDRRVGAVVRQDGRRGCLDRLAHRARLATREGRIAAVDREDAVRSERKARHADRRRTTGERARSHHGVTIAGIFQAQRLAVRWRTTD